MSRRSSPASADSVSRGTSCSLRSSARRSRSKRSLGTCCLDSLNPHRPLTSVVTARSTFAAVPAAPVSLSSFPLPRPEGPFCVDVSRACPRRTPRTARGHLFSPARRRPIVWCPDARHRVDLALRSRELEPHPLSEWRRAGSRTTRWFASSTAFSGRLGSGFFTLYRARPPPLSRGSGGARQARSLRLTTARERPLARRADSNDPSASLGNGGRQRSRSCSTDVSNPRFCFQDGHPFVPAHSAP
jgi:hypothetical protein